MAIKKNPTKTTRTPKSKSAVENSAPNPTVAAVPSQVNPSVQITEAENKPDSRAGSTAAEPPVAKPDLTSTPGAASKPQAASPPEASVKLDARNKIFEVRKPEARQNVVPINLEDEIRRRAYELSQQRHPGIGSEADDWFTAEHEVRQRYHQQSA